MLGRRAIKYPFTLWKEEKGASNRRANLLLPNRNRHDDSIHWWMKNSIHSSVCHLPFFATSSEERRIQEYDTCILLRVTLSLVVVDTFVFRLQWRALELIRVHRSIKDGIQETKKEHPHTIAAIRLDSTQSQNRVLSLHHIHMMWSSNLHTFSSELRQQYRRRAIN